MHKRVMVTATALAIYTATLLGQAWGQAAPPVRSRYFTTLTNTEIEEYLRHSDVIVVPVGTAEGFNNMPTDLEYAMAEAYALKIAEEAGGLVLPHLLYFYPGVTATAKGSVYVAEEECLRYLKAVAHSLLRQGFRRQIYTSSHGPSNQYVAALVRDFFEETKDPIVYVETSQLTRMAQQQKLLPENPGNVFQLVGYGAYAILGRLNDIPLTLDFKPTGPPVPAPPESLRKLSPLGPGSGAVGTYSPNNGDNGGRPLRIAITAQQREEMGKQGAAIIEAGVKAMDVKGVVQAMRDYDKYIHDVIVPRYGDTLPK
jgi:creatinine amidohydrolase